MTVASESLPAESIVIRDDGTSAARPVGTNSAVGRVLPQPLEAGDLKLVDRRAEPAGRCRDAAGEPHHPPHDHERDHVPASSPASRGG